MKSKKQKTITINKTDLLLNSSGKLGRHISEVSAGCGRHRSKKDYTRKQKHKSNSLDYSNLRVYLCTLNLE